VVPCAKEKSIQDVFKQLNFLEWAGISNRNKNN